MGGTGNKILREEAYNLAKKVLNRLEGIKRARICGSIRRKKDYVGDIDIVIVPTDPPKEFYASIGKLAEIGHFEAVGKRNVRFVKDGIQIDLMIVDKDSFESACLHLTGSKQFNIKCRAKAKMFGLMLNEYGLWKGAEKVARTEEEILTMLEMEKYLDPITRS